MAQAHLRIDFNQIKVNESVEKMDLDTSPDLSIYLLRLAVLLERVSSIQPKELKHYISEIPQSR